MAACLRVYGIGRLRLVCSWCPSLDSLTYINTQQANSVDPSAALRKFFRNYNDIHLFLAITEMNYLQYIYLKLTASQYCLLYGCKL